MMTKERIIQVRLWRLGGIENAKVRLVQNCYLTILQCLKMISVSKKKVLWANEIMSSSHKKKRLRNAKRKVFCHNHLAWDLSKPSGKTRTSKMQISIATTNYWKSTRVSWTVRSNQAQWHLTRRLNSLVNSFLSQRNLTASKLSTI